MRSALGESAMQGVDPIGVACLCFGSFILVFGLYSRIIKDAYLSEPLLSTLFGILLGPEVLGVLTPFPDNWDEGLADDAARGTLRWTLKYIIGVQVLFAASTLPSRYLLQPENIRTQAILLLPVMTLSWLISSGLVLLCLPSTSAVEALLVGACVACTDPVLCNSVVKGAFAERHVPRHVRELLAAESGLNDGFGAPFLWLPLFAVLHGYSARPTLLAFVWDTLLWDVLFGSALGAGIGYAARKCLKVARRKDTIDRESMLVFSVALATFSIGLADILHTNELLACFFAGTAVNWTDKIRAEDLHSHFSEGIELFFDATVFLVIGALLPWRTWLAQDFLPPGRLALLGGLVLVFRRLPAVLALYRFTPQIKTLREAAFVGWFGPIGVGALYYSLVASEKLPDDFFSGQNRIIPTVTFLVLCSIIGHGSSAPLLMLARAVPVPGALAGLLGKPADGTSDAAVDTEADVAGAPAAATERTPLLVDGASITREQIDDARKAAEAAGAHVVGRAYRAMGDPDTHRHRSRARGDAASATDAGGRGARVTAYDEGSSLIIDDDEGHVSVRRIARSVERRAEQV